MGETAHQHLAGFLLGQLRLFLGDAQQSITGMDFQQQQSGTVVQDRRDGVIHGQGLAGQGGEHCFTLGEQVGLLHRLAQGVERFGGFGE